LVYDKRKEKAAWPTLSGRGRKISAQGEKEGKATLSAHPSGFKGSAGVERKRASYLFGERGEAKNLPGGHKKPQNSAWNTGCSIEKKKSDDRPKRREGGALLVRVKRGGGGNSFATKDP